MKTIFTVLIIIIVLSLIMPAIAAETRIIYPSPEKAEQELKILLPQYKGNKKDVELLRQIGLCYHSLGGAGDANAVVKSMDFFNKALRLEPKNNELKAWLGSATLIRARDVWVLEQPKYLSTGTSLINAAVLAEPDSLNIRFIRVNTYLPLPSFLGQNDIVVSDLEFILKHLQGSDDKELLQDTYYKLGLAYKKINNANKAKENFNMAIKVDKDSKIAHKIAKEEHL